ncbi:MAG: BppU family phage baseplate upper protein, partial [Clostridia bacterium]|nr:BppU family phage baseplate upper protein [Clostridia bacterium]
MLEIIREITLDVSEENRFTAITAKQYDSRSRYLLVRLTDRGEALTLPDTASVLISATRPDGLSDGFEGLVQDGAALVPLDYWMLMLDGTVTCELVVTGADGYRLTTLSFALDVRHSCFGDGLTPGGNHGAYVRLLHEIEDLKKKIGEGLGGNGTVTDEQIYAAVEKYLTEHPIESPEVEKAAESARKSAEDAEASVGEARTAADEAGESASNAGRCATAAAESASQAVSSAEAADSSTSAARTAKEGAETAKNEAAQQATNAGNAAQEAVTAAENAGKAQTAAESAKSTASQKATEATNAAQTATSKATEAAEANA